ncbi:hypothetical protein [Paenibacillus xerothermodurans]|uniref:Lipoprotein n=1 Tax=Paenibacillus xerothermodurans TaxID=1977292 RepID=A0A2W1NLF6_PAEXE|nr:hypothetical protein [Paenibacillus xerothermodurans]PZE20255.1 hypothetical protein CBW46_013985 [Paenibacillus xerothermodurans]
MLKKGLIIFIVLFCLVGCNSGNKNNFITDFKAKTNEGANLWTSVNYDIVRDTQLINEIDKASRQLETPIIIRVFVETINKGNQSAESIGMKLNEPMPMLQKNSSSFSGVTDGSLDKDEIFEYYFTYTFANEKALESFIKQASVSVSWTENQVSNEIRINLPSKPLE